MSPDIRKVTVSLEDGVNQSYVISPGAGRGLPANQVILTCVHSVTFMESPVTERVVLSW